MRTRLRVLAAIGAVVMPLTAAVLPAQAANAQAPAQPGPGQSCVSVLGKAAAGKDSPELYRYCSDKPFDSQAHLQSAAAQTELRRSLVARGATSVQAEQQAKAAVNLHILRAWDAANYAGEYWDYYANDADGRCDSAGYSWRPSDWWSTHISSLERGWNAYCNTVTLYNRQDTQSVTWEMNVSVMWGFNDNVKRLQIFNGNGRP